MPHTIERHTSPEMQSCINHCLDCHNICSETLRHCLEKGAQFGEESIVMKLMDCADICETNANSMLRESPLWLQIAGVCAQVCEECGDLCDRFSDDEQMRYCAEACRRCQEACETLATMAAHV